MLDSLLTSMIPEFRNHWNQDDIHKEVDGTFTPHGIMGSFLEFYQRNFLEISNLQISTLCIEFETIVAKDPNDTDLNANAICTMFLELLVNTPAGNKIEPYLGKQCKRFWNCYKF